LCSNSDAAVVIAAQLSDCYITNRLLPDKAVDLVYLVDEAAAAKRTALGSRPEKIDQLERRILQLEIESTALGREKDKASKKRRASIQGEIATSGRNSLRSVPSGTRIAAVRMS
jgi:ATP-dependent Clp protease ATP-binding subunit ClpB